ncbi:hypothetical protein BC940DRAFT_311824 [Gongronella butleri]|nr:hypothetical protein BC940DRAFT_311824 [Gongronella butleri]
MKLFTLTLVLVAGVTSTLADKLAKRSNDCPASKMTCPELDINVNCFVDPCLGISCPAGSRCCPDYRNDCQYLCC